MDDRHGSVWQELLHATEKLATNDHRIAAIEERLRYIQEHLLSVFRIHTLATKGNHHTVNTASLAYTDVE